MDSVKEHLLKVRAERQAREKARIEKLRELNLKKYNTNQPKNTNMPTELKPVKNISSMKNNESRPVNNKQTNQTGQRNGSQKAQNVHPCNSKLPANMNNRKMIMSASASVRTSQQTGPVPSTSRETLTSSKITISQKSQNTNRESVFERLYKPKPQVKTHTNNDQKLPTNPKCLKKNMQQTTNALSKKRYTTFDPKTKDPPPPIRRSISAVHFKRINKNELSNCIHKYASIGDKLDSIHLKDINEDENIMQSKVVSAVKSERKKVKFMTPISQNYNTPRPEEMQTKLKSWLQKRGKSFDTYRHLQCFGMNHMTQKMWQFDPEVSSKIELSDDDNKENIAVESDSDDGSYMENINGDKKNEQFDAWRKVSVVSESFELNETVNSTLTSADTPSNPNNILFGALNDLTDLLKEDFEWEQCARWLRAIRERFPSAVDTAPYWECRAALEEHRGDLPASMECWEQAIAKGTERSVVEANLDQLLDKFMQLKISPNSGKRRQVDPKMIDIKNVFKSTIIRFAVHQEKLRQSNQDPAKYTVTPVRRSGRLSIQANKRSPFKECPSFKQFPQEAPTIKQLRETLGENLKFVPNATLCRTP